MAPVLQRTTRMRLLWIACVVTGCGSSSSTPVDTGPIEDATPDSVSIAAPCDPSTTGLIAPLPTCSPTHPCVRLALEVPQVPITTASDPIACADPRWTGRRSWTIDGVVREACVFSPSGSEPRALVLWFHPGGLGGDVAEQETHVLDKAVAAGFHLAVVQGRNLHFPTEAPRDGRHHDFYYRDLRSPSLNPDIVSADHLIDLLVAEGAIDPRRIHVMGWSNGAFFGQLYAIARHTTPTPGGSRIASAAVFAGADPFGDIERNPFTDEPWDASPRCELTTTPRSAVPILLVHRTCDLAVPCGPTDFACFGAEPNFETSRWLASAQVRGVTGLEGHLIGGVELGAAADLDANACTVVAGSTCDPTPCRDDPTSSGCLCLVNHLRWPDGQYNAATGVDREPLMLEFLRDHPLP